MICGFSVPLADPQFGKSVVGPRTFTTVLELLWYNYSPVCGLSAQRLSGGAHTLHSPGLLSQSPCPLTVHCWPVPPQETLKESKAGLAQSLVGFLVSGAQKVFFEPSEHLWRVWGLILNAISPLLLFYWGFSFALGHVVSFCVCWGGAGGGDPSFSCQWLFSD